MPTVADVVGYVFEIAPDPKPPERSENGLLLGEGEAHVDAIAVMWRPTPELLEQAGQSGANLVVGHEPLLFAGTRDYFWGHALPEDEKPINKIHRGLMERYGMAYARFHSNVDIVREWGQPAALLDVLGYRDCPTEWGKYIPLVRVPALRVGGLADHCRQRLGLSHTRVTGDVDAHVSRLGICWGGISRNGTGIDCAIRLGADCILGGDMTDAAAMEAEAAGVPVIECGHAHTEMPAMRILAQKLGERFEGLPVRFLANDEPWVVHGAT